MMFGPAEICLLAHSGPAVSPGEAWRFWNWDPVLLLNLALLALLYQRGLRDRSQRAGGLSRSARMSGLAFAGGILVIFIALASPLDTASDQLASAHMFQHMLLMMVAAPLFALGAPGRALLAGLPQLQRQELTHWRRTWWWRGFSRLAWQPVVVWLIQAFVLWLWHLPLLYQAALENSMVHDVQHLTFFASAFLFWRVLLDPVSRRRLDRGAGVLALFTTCLHTSALGVFMALAPQVWYPAYGERTVAWGLTALEDQQLAGFLMWILGGTLYGIVAAVLFVLWLEEPRPRGWTGAIARNVLSKADASAKY